MSGKDLLELTEEDYIGSLHATHLQMKKMKRALNEILGVAEPSQSGSTAQLQEVPTPPPGETATPSTDTYGIPPPLPNQPQAGLYQNFGGPAPAPVPAPGPGPGPYPPPGYPTSAPPGPYTAPPPNGFTPMPGGPSPPPPPPPQWVPYGAPPPPGYTPSSYGGRPQGDCCVQ